MIANNIQSYDKFDYKGIVLAKLFAKGLCDEIYGGDIYDGVCTACPDS